MRHKFWNHFLNLQQKYTEKFSKKTKVDHEICKLIPRDSWSMEPLKYASEVEAKIDHFWPIMRNENKTKK